MQHEVILKMIKEVSPSDTAKLDEIDARVWAYLDLHDRKIDFYNGHYVRRKRIGEDVWILPTEDKAPQYTRSRDALKAIRPEGWTFAVDASAPECGIDFDLFQGGELSHLIQGKGKTEELAELHAIIQAIAYEKRS